MTVVELRPGLHRLEEPDGLRRLCQYVVQGEKRTLVVDAGLPESPERGLLPLLSDRPPVVLLLTHPDADHRGGAPVLRDALPELKVWCHELDRDQLSDPEVALAERYLAFAASDGVGPVRDRLEAIRARLGRPVRVDCALAGDTSLDLGGRRAEILHMPGHSPGSVRSSPATSRRSRARTRRASSPRAARLHTGCGRSSAMRSSGRRHSPSSATPSISATATCRPTALRTWR